MSSINPISNALQTWQTQGLNRANAPSRPGTDFTPGPDFPGRVIRVRPIPSNPFAGQATTQPTDPTRRADPTRPTESTGRPDRARSTSVDRPGPRTGTAYQTNADGDSVTLSSKQLSPEEQEQVSKLRARDQEVRTHEEAHKATAGSLYRGGPYYDYQTGPDGKRYAVGGRVSIDTSPADSPEATVVKAQKIRAAALAPAEPSSTDQRVAAKAAQMEAAARAELAKEQQGKTSPDRTAISSEPNGERANTYSTSGSANNQSNRPTLDLVA